MTPRTSMLAVAGVVLIVLLGSCAPEKPSSPPPSPSAPSATFVPTSLERCAARVAPTAWTPPPDQAVDALPGRRWAYEVATVDPGTAVLTSSTLRVAGTTADGLATVASIDVPTGAVSAYQSQGTLVATSRLGGRWFALADEATSTTELFSVVDGAVKACYVATAPAQTLPPLTYRPRPAQLRISQNAASFAAGDDALFLGLDIGENPSPTVQRLALSAPAGTLSAPVPSTQLDGLVGFSGVSDGGVFAVTATATPAVVQLDAALATVTTLALDSAATRVWATQLPQDKTVVLVQAGEPSTVTTFSSTGERLTSTPVANSTVADVRWVGAWVYLWDRPGPPSGPSSGTASGSASRGQQDGATLRAVRVTAGAVAEVVPVVDGVLGEVTFAADDGKTLAVFTSTATGVAVADGAVVLDGTRQLLAATDGYQVAQVRSAQASGVVVAGFVRP